MGSLRFLSLFEYHNSLTFYSDPDGIHNVFFCSVSIEALILKHITARLSPGIAATKIMRNVKHLHFLRTFTSAKNTII